MGRFDGRVSLVSGAGGGIGAATARRLASEGAVVVCADVDADAARATAEAIGGDALAVACDVADPASCATAVAAAVEGFGGVDVLANVAGVGAFGRTIDLDRATWDRTIAVNLTGTFTLIQAALPSLLERRGTVVNVASVAGLRAVPYNAAYCASKAGVVMLTKSLAVELAKQGVRVNCVCPSAVDTPFLEGFQLTDDLDLSLMARTSSPMGRVLEADEVAAAIAYLASDDARTVTGHALVLDGGATA